MQETRLISQEIFDAMVDGAIDDLRRSGVGQAEIYRIVEDQFGLRYARMFCSEPCYEEDHYSFRQNGG
jgi:hypothetical protein